MEWSTTPWHLTIALQRMRGQARFLAYFSMEQDPTRLSLAVRRSTSGIEMPLASSRRPYLLLFPVLGAVAACEPPPNASLTRYPDEGRERFIGEYRDLE